MTKYYRRVPTSRGTLFPWFCALRQTDIMKGDFSNKISNIKTIHVFADTLETTSSSLLKGDNHRTRVAREF